MLNLQTTQQLITIISFFIAYLITVTFAGSLRAWISDKMGDDTAANMGLTSLNPILHIDPMGFTVGVLFYLLFGIVIAWGKYVPINPHNIIGRFRWLRLSIAFFSNTIAYLLLALISLVMLISLFDMQILWYTKQMIIHEALIQRFIAQAYTNHSPLVISIGFILILLIYLSIILGVIYTFINLFAILLFHLSERRPSSSVLYNPYVMFIVPLVLIMFFSGPLRILLTELVMFVGQAIAKMLHIG